MDPDIGVEEQRALVKQVREIIDNIYKVSYPQPVRQDLATAYLMGVGYSYDEAVSIVSSRGS